MKPLFGKLAGRCIHVKPRALDGPALEVTVIGSSVVEAGVDLSHFTNTALLLDKPLDWTSFDACNYVRKLLRIKKVGHAGTLDPKATGLLVICVGKATKLVDAFVGMDKTYTGVMRLGESRPSFDMETEVDARLPWEHLGDEELGQAAASMLGDMQQLPPMHSAIRIQGERLYHKARRGERIERLPRAVKVTRFDVWRDPSDRQNVHFRVDCSKGTYIRTLTHDWGVALGSAACLRELRREAIGEYHVRDALPVHELGALVTRLKQAAGVVDPPPKPRQQRRRGTAAAGDAAAAAAAQAGQPGVEALEEGEGGSPPTEPGGSTVEWGAQSSEEERLAAVERTIAAITAKQQRRLAASAERLAAATAAAAAAPS